MTLPTVEIIPNWHPLFVHFTIGLFSIAVIFYFASASLPKKNRWKQQWLTMANWSLWSGCLLTFATAIAGWLAYNSVAHDSASHSAMTLHRNWALPTAAAFLLLGLWAILLAKKGRRPGFLFLSYSALAGTALMVTGCLGSEAVYRYGLGVKSLPKVEAGADGHNHNHGGGDGHNHSHGNGVSDGYDHKHSADSDHTDDSSGSKSEAGADGHSHSHGEGVSDGHDHGVDSGHLDDSTGSKSEAGADSYNHNHEGGASDGHEHKHGVDNGHQHDPTETKPDDHESKPDKEPEENEHTMVMELEKSLQPTVSSDSHAHSHTEESSHNHQH